MVREIIWTQATWKDLEFVADYIAQDSKHYAAAIVLEARDASRSLAEMAERGRKVPEMNDRQIRELLLGSYRLIYRVQPETVHILAFIHGARDLQKAWRRNR